MIRITTKGRLALRKVVNAIKKQVDILPMLNRLQIEKSHLEVLDLLSDRKWYERVVAKKDNSLNVLLGKQYIELHPHHENPSCVHQSPSFMLRMRHH